VGETTTLDLASAESARPWLTVLTWNVHGLPFFRTRERLRRITSWISDQQPDIVFLQEVWLLAYLKLLIGACERDYRAVFAPHRFTRRARGGLLTLIRKNGWQGGQISFEPYRAAAPRRRLYEGDGVSGKGILAVELCRGDERLRAINTHLQAQYGERHYDDVRQGQLEQLAAFVARADDSVPLLLAGDLNVEAGESLYRSHLAPVAVDLTEEERRLRGGTTCFDRSGGRTEWIDYVFLRGVDVSASVTRVENIAPDDPYSDHDAVLVKISR